MSMIDNSDNIVSTEQNPKRKSDEFVASGGPLKGLKLKKFKSLCINNDAVGENHYSNNISQPPQQNTLRDDLYNVFNKNGSSLSTSTFRDKSYKNSLEKKKSKKNLKVSNKTDVNQFIDTSFSNKHSEKEMPVIKSSGKSPFYSAEQINEKSLVPEDHGRETGPPYPVEKVKEKSLDYGTEKSKKTCITNPFEQMKDKLQITESEDIVDLIKKVNTLETQLLSDIHQKEEIFNQEKVAWKVRENQLLEKYEKVQREVVHLKQLPKIKPEPPQSLNEDSLNQQFLLDNINSLEEQINQKEELISAQTKKIESVELDICEKDDLITSLKHDLELKQKEILNKGQVILKLQEEKKILELSEERENELKKKIDGHIKENQNKDQIIVEIKTKEKESEELIKDLQNNILSKDELISEIKNEKQEVQYKYEESTNITIDLKRQNEELKADNLDLQQSKEIEAEKLAKVMSNTKKRIYDLVQQFQSQQEKNTCLQEKIVEQKEQISDQEGKIIDLKKLISSKLYNQY